MDGLVISNIGGKCPVQAEGTIDGVEFYFRARGERWTMGIGGEPVLEPAWFLELPYGDEDNKSAAGWMTDETARKFIDVAVRLWRAERALAPAKSAEDQYDLGPMYRSAPEGFWGRWHRRIGSAFGWLNKPVYEPGKVTVCAYDYSRPCSCGDVFDCPHKPEPADDTASMPYAPGYPPYQEPISYAPPGHQE